MYEDLLNQYESLSNQEKNALLIYKSRLGIVINDLDNNPDFNKYYNFMINVLNNPVNAFIKISVFNSLDLTNIDTFTSSIYKVRDLIIEALNKMTINEKITVFRAVSTNSEINDISKSNIVSTSLSFSETLKFAMAGENINIYQINLEKNSKVAIIPYSITFNTKTNQLKLSNNDTQSEIIINKDLYDFENIASESNNNISIIELNAKLKESRKR